MKLREECLGANSKGIMFSQLTYLPLQLPRPIVPILQCKRTSNGSWGGDRLISSNVRSPFRTYAPYSVRSLRYSSSKDLTNAKGAVFRVAEKMKGRITYCCRFRYYAQCEAHLVALDSELGLLKNRLTIVSTSPTKF